MPVKSRKDVCPNKFRHNFYKKKIFALEKKIAQRIYLKSILININ